MSASFSARLNAYIHADRQWPRMRRIGYARYMRQHSGKKDHPFWDAVLEANGVIFNTNGKPTMRVEPSTRFMIKRAERNEQKST